MTTYRDAGVDIDAKTQALQNIGQVVKATHSAAVLAGLGAFGGCFDLAGLTQQQPVLVASTDGIGTKTMVATAMHMYDQLGADLVHHCINDILCQGAQPLFFMDYIAASKLEPAMVVELVTSLAQACQEQGVALLGGETAEMPGVYHAQAFDIAGTIVGVVDKAKLLDGSAIEAGQAVLALPSSGLHTNGYSLARAVCEPLGYHTTPKQLGGRSIGDALLAAHRCYQDQINALNAAQVPVYGLIHITGGGIWDNIPRVVPERFQTQLKRGSWFVPAICEFIVEQAQLDEYEAHHVLNMGLGMLIITDATKLTHAQQIVPEIQYVGNITRRTPEEARVALVADFNSGV